MANLNLQNSSNIKVVQNDSNISLDFASGGQVETNTTAIGTLANLNTTDKTNLVNAINEVNSFKIAYGTTGLVSQSGSGYKDTNIDFSSAGFTTDPVVIAGLQGNSTGVANGSGSVAVVASSLTTTGCTLRYYNNSTSSPANYINWIAIGT